MHFVQRDTRSKNDFRKSLTNVNSNKCCAHSFNTSVFYALIIYRVKKDLTLSTCHVISQLQCEIMFINLLVLSHNIKFYAKMLCITTFSQSQEAKN